MQAKKHVLVLSRLDGLDSLEDAKKEHLPLLRSMHSAGVKWVQKFLSEDSSLSFRLGYHSVCAKCVYEHVRCSLYFAYNFACLVLYLYPTGSIHAATASSCYKPGF